MKRHGSDEVMIPQKEGVLDLTSNEEANKFRFVLNDEEIRTGIATYFCLIFDPLDEWGGVGGSISIIQRELNIPSRSRGMIQKALREVMQAHKEGRYFWGARLPDSGGHNKLIEAGSLEEKIAAGYIESGVGLSETARMINMHLNEQRKKTALGLRRRGGPAKPAQEPRKRAPRLGLEFL
jgi:hypothetical protein